MIFGLNLLFLEISMGLPMASLSESLHAHRHPVNADVEMDILIWEELARSLNYDQRTPEFW